MILKDLSVGDTFKFKNVSPAAPGRGPVPEAFRNHDMRVVGMSAGDGFYHCTYVDDTEDKTVTSFFADREVVPISRTDDNRFSFDVEIVRVDQEHKTVLFYTPGNFDEAAATLMFEYHERTGKIDDTVGERFRITMERID